MSAQGVAKNLASDSDSLQELIEASHASQILFDSLLFNKLLWDYDANMTMDHNYDDNSAILIHSHLFHCHHHESFL